MTRMRTIVLTVMALALPALPAVIVAGGAEAATPRCAGKRVTIVASTQEVFGTPRADVILAKGNARYVEARGGDDRVCFKGRTGRRAVLYGGLGDDMLRNETSADTTFYDGRGKDRMISGPGDDTTYSFDGNAVDVFRMGAGDDIVGNHAPGGRADRIDLGRGDDLMTVDTPITRGPVPVGGRGSDMVLLQRLAGTAESSWVIDNSADDQLGTALVDGTPKLGWHNFEQFRMLMPSAEQRFIGGREDERIEFSTRDVGASMGGGDDETLVYTGARGTTPLDGGEGNDVAAAYVSLDPDDTVTGSLLTDEITYPLGDTSLTVALQGYEGLSVTSTGEVELTGDDGPNRLNVFSCAATVHAGDGADLLTASGGFFDEDDSCVPAANLFGETGDDTLVGSWGDDSLTGGDGIDSADGARGTDTCDAETRIRCES